MNNALTNDLLSPAGHTPAHLWSGPPHRSGRRAISRAGRLGVYAAARDGQHELPEERRQLRELCPDHPVGVDLLLPPACLNTTTGRSRGCRAAAGAQGFRAGPVPGQYDVPPATEGNFFAMRTLAKLVRGAGGRHCGQRYRCILPPASV